MKWSLLLGRLWGTEIRLHGSMVLLIPYALLTFQTDSMADALYLLVLIAAIFVCVGIHELGHTIAARLFGIEVKSIVLWPLGGFANLSRRPESVWKDLVISAAGPLANMILFAFLGLLAVLVFVLQGSFFSPRLSYLLANNEIFSFLVSLTAANFSLAVFNLLPVFPLDGGQIARGIFKMIFGERSADLILLIISLPLALLLLAFGFIARDLVIILSGLLMALAILTLNPRLSEGLTMAALYIIDRPGYHLKRGDYDRAIAEYTRAIQRSPDRAGLYVSRAVAHMNLSDIEATKADIRQALRLDANNPIAWTLAGEILMLIDQPDRALQAFNRSIQAKPSWPVPYLDRGDLYQRQGRFAEAQQDMTHAIELEPGAPLSYLFRSRLRHQMGDLAGAKSDAGQALRFAPQWMLTFSEVFLNNFNGHLRWALDYYQLAMQRMPNAFQVYQGRADACRVNNQLHWAMADYNRAIKIAPNRPELYINRGRTLLLLGKPEAAAQDFQTAARLADKAHIQRMAGELLTQAQPGGMALPATAPSEPLG